MTDCYGAYLPDGGTLPYSQKVERSKSNPKTRIIKINSLLQESSQFSSEYETQSHSPLQNEVHATTQNAPDKLTFIADSFATNNPSCNLNKSKDSRQETVNGDFMSTFDYDFVDSVQQRVFSNVDSQNAVKYSNEHTTSSVFYSAESDAIGCHLKKQLSKRRISKTRQKMPLEKPQPCNEDKLTAVKILHENAQSTLETTEINDFRLSTKQDRGNNVQSLTLKNATCLTETENSTPGDVADRTRSTHNNCSYKSDFTLENRAVQRLLTLKERSSVRDSEMDTETIDVTNTENKDETINNTPSISSTSFIRNDPHKRFSMRETRNYHRNKEFDCLGPRKMNNSEFCEKRYLSAWGRSVSLPSQNFNTSSDSAVWVWNSGSVENKIWQLEEDMARTMMEHNVPPDFDVQSFLSLDIERIAPDGDDYQLVFISSSAASQDSDTEDQREIFSDWPQIPMEKRWLREVSNNTMYHSTCTLASSIDWDMSLGSSVEDKSSSSDDELELFSSSSTTAETEKILNDKLLQIESMFTINDFATDLSDDAESKSITPQETEKYCKYSERENSYFEEVNGGIQNVFKDTDLSSSDEKNFANSKYEETANYNLFTDSISTPNNSIIDYINHEINIVNHDINQNDTTYLENNNNVFYASGESLEVTCRNCMSQFCFCTLPFEKDKLSLNYPTTPITEVPYYPLNADSTHGNGTQISYCLKNKSLSLENFINCECSKIMTACLCQIQKIKEPSSEFGRNAEIYLSNERNDEKNILENRISPSDVTFNLIREPFTINEKFLNPYKISFFETLEGGTYDVLSTKIFTFEMLRYLEMCKKQTVLHFIPEILDKASNEEHIKKASFTIGDKYVLSPSARKEIANNFEDAGKVYKKRPRLLKCKAVMGSLYSELNNYTETINQDGLLSVYNPFDSNCCVLPCSLGYGTQLVAEKDENNDVLCHSSVMFQSHNTTGAERDENRAIERSEKRILDQNIVPNIVPITTDSCHNEAVNSRPAQERKIRLTRQDASLTVEEIACEEELNSLFACVEETNGEIQETQNVDCATGNNNNPLPEKNKNYFNTSGLEPTDNREKLLMDFKVKDLILETKMLWQNSKLSIWPILSLNKKETHILQIKINNPEIKSYSTNKSIGKKQNPESIESKSLKNHYLNCPSPVVTCNISILRENNISITFVNIPETPNETHISDKNLLISDYFNARSESVHDFNEVGLSETPESSTPEIGVIDTQLTSTSETGSTAFVEFSSLNVVHENEARLHRSRLGLTVPADQQAEAVKRESVSCTLAGGRCYVPYASTSRITELKSCQRGDVPTGITCLPSVGVAVQMTQKWCEEKLEDFCDYGVPKLDYLRDGEAQITDSQNVDMCVCTVPIVETLASEVLTSIDVNTNIVSEACFCGKKERCAAVCVSFIEPSLREHRGGKIANACAAYHGYYTTMDSSSFSTAVRVEKHESNCNRVIKKSTGNAFHSDGIKCDTDLHSNQNKASCVLQDTLTKKMSINVSRDKCNGSSVSENEEKILPVDVNTDNEHYRHRQTGGGDLIYDKIEAVDSSKDIKGTFNGLPSNSYCITDSHVSTENKLYNSLEDSKTLVKERTVAALVQKFDANLGTKKQSSCCSTKHVNNVNGVSTVQITSWCNDKVETDSINNLPSEDNLNLTMDSLSLSTAELNSLIAVSRAELSKKEEPSLTHTKSTLENYFTFALENESHKVQRSGTYPLKSADKLSSNTFVNLDNSQQEFYFDTVQNLHSTSHLPTEINLSTIHGFSKDQSAYNECDIDEVNFDDMDDAVLSDSSSEDDNRYPMLPCNTHYSQASYSLHTIIEESCEESEKDSRSVTPTNQEPASKLERYFSWDIINDTEIELKQIENDDECSTIFSDSLSEASGSINEGCSKDVEPSHLASSRLEKYFTSGLVGNESYFYPDDAEFLDDASISDFEDENFHHKISRAALLSSLEMKPDGFSDSENASTEYHSDVEKKSQHKVDSFKNEDGSSSDCKNDNYYYEPECTATTIDYTDCLLDVDENETKCSFHTNPNIKERHMMKEENCQLIEKECEDKINVLNENDKSGQCKEVHSMNAMVVDVDTLSVKQDENIYSNEDTVFCCKEITDVIVPDSIINTFEEKILNAPAPEQYNIKTNDNIDEIKFPENISEKIQKHPEKSDNENYLDEEAQALMKKIILHLSDTSFSNESKAEMDYISAWKVLETEIERLMQTVSPLSILENGSSCSSSTIGSNNSDYGSDTVEPAESITTDEDDHFLETKNKLDPCEALAAVLQSAYRRGSNTSGCSDSTDSNVSEDTLYIWKRLMFSLKDDKLLTQHEGSDEYSRARLYIRDQIIALMHTVTASQNNSPARERKKSGDLPQDKSDIISIKDETNISTEAIDDIFNRTVRELETLSKAAINDVADEHEIKILKTELQQSSAVDEGISVDSSDNLQSDSDNTCSPCSTIGKRVSMKIDQTLNSEQAEITEQEIQEACDMLERVIASENEVKEILLDLSDVLNTSELYSENLNCEKPCGYESEDMDENTKTDLNSSLIFCDNQIPALAVENSAKEEISGVSQQQNELKTELGNKDEKFRSSLYVDFEVEDESLSLSKCLDLSVTENVDNDSENGDRKRTSLHLWVSDQESQLTQTGKNKVEENIPSDLRRDSDHLQHLPLEDCNYINESSEIINCHIEDSNCESQNLFSMLPEKVNCEPPCRDTGYYSFKSSDDSIRSISDATNGQDLSSSVIHQKINVEQQVVESESQQAFITLKDGTSNFLSLSSSNIPQNVSKAEAKFCTLQPKASNRKVSMNPSPSVSATSRPLASFFSPAAVFRKLTAGKNSGISASEMPIPSKYIKKYRRSASADSESMFGATSMPHLCMQNHMEVYAASGVFADSDRDSSITLDDEIERKHTYSSCSQSVLSLGQSHSASMTSVYSAAGGRHFDYVSISGDVLFGLNYNQKSQMMEVFVKQCRNLAAVDPRRNKSDPYVKVYLLPDKTKSGKRKTKTKKNTLNPVFNELLRFPVLKQELESRTLWLSVWNSDIFGRNDFLGEIMLALGYRLLDSPTLRWYPLQERTESLTSPLNYKGELFLALKYVPKDLSLESRFRPAPVISLTGALHVLIKEARNITATRSNGTSDSFCKSYLLPDKSKNSKQKTPVVKKSRHPKWYYTVIYEDLTVDELKERSLELTLWDYDKITSNEFMGGVRLNLGNGLYHGVPVDWMDSHRDETSIWQAMLDRPNMWVDGSLPLRPTMQSWRS